MIARRSPFAALVVLALLALAAPAGATFPAKNGKKIYFMRDTFAGPFQPPVGDIWVVGATGGTPKQLTHTGGLTGDPAVSPSGRRVAWDSDVTGTPQIYLMKPSGKHKRAITHAKSASFDPAWSPNGRRIAFSGVRKGVSGIFTMSSNGKHVKRVATVGASTSAFAATWSPNGRKIAFQSNGDGDFEIYIARAKGKGKVKQLTHQSTNTFDGEPDFSPNGKFIVFDEAGAIKRMKPDGSHVKTVVAGTSLSAPQYSPDGRKLVYTDNDHLTVAHADGAHPHVLTMPPGASSDLAPTWAPKP